MADITLTTADDLVFDLDNQFDGGFDLGPGSRFPKLISGGCASKLGFSSSSSYPFAVIPLCSCLDCRHARLFFTDNIKTSACRCYF